MLAVDDAWNEYWGVSPGAQLHGAAASEVDEYYAAAPEDFWRARREAGIDVLTRTVAATVAAFALELYREQVEKESMRYRLGAAPD